MAKDLKISFLLDFYGDMLTDKQKEVVDYYYNDDLSLSEIAENEGITRQGVRDAIKRAEEQLLEMEKRLGFAGRYRAVREGIREIKDAAERIADYNDHYSCSREIGGNADRILQTVRKLMEQERGERFGV